MSASSEPVTYPVTPPALVPPWNSSALEAPLSQLHTDSRDSRNLVLCSNSGITNTTLNITISSLVPVPVPVPNLVPVPIPCSSIAFLCFPCCTHCFPVFRSVFCYVPVPNGYALWLVCIDPTLYYIQYVQILTLTIVLIVYWTSGHFRHPNNFCNPIPITFLIPIYWKYPTSIIRILGLLEIPPYSEFHLFEILLACFTLNSMLTSM